MKAGYLNDYFKGVAVKRLSAVEADASISNQHEYNGVVLLKKLFGTQTQKRIIPTEFMYLSDDEDPIEAKGTLTWYDSRFNHPTRTEWRLYYPPNDVTLKAEPKDSLFICVKEDDTVLEIITESKSNIENQLFWLFDIEPYENSGRFVAKTDLQNWDVERASFTARAILSTIGIEVPYGTGHYNNMVIRKYGAGFPTTKEFSEFARSTVEIDPIVSPDLALLLWYEREEEMFMCLERHLIAERLRNGFFDGSTVDVDSFIKFSLSVNNRRKARAGFSLENHLEALFKANRIRYSHTPTTENKSKPDFIFPSIGSYKDYRFPVQYLTMLGAKTTAKDRWRQVLEEADQIERKHLITLEGAISENQTNEMKSRNLQLVVPKGIHKTFTGSQRSWLYSVADFIREVKRKQRLAETRNFIF